MAGLARNVPKSSAMCLATAVREIIHPLHHEGNATNHETVRRRAIPAGAGPPCICSGGVQSRSVLYAIRTESDRPASHDFRIRIPCSLDFRVRAPSHIGQGMGGTKAAEAGLEI